MKRLLFLALAAFVVVSCSRIEESDLTPSTIPSTATSTAGPPQTRAATFTKLNNPYSLANMQAVYREFSSTTLQATHKYVRFLPSTKEQLDLLEETLDLELFEYPLDIEIPDGVEYVDSSIPEGVRISIFL